MTTATPTTATPTASTATEVTATLMEDMGMDTVDMDTVDIVDMGTPMAVGVEAWMPIWEVCVDSDALITDLCGKRGKLFMFVLY